MAQETKRGCGYRRVGGIYLVGSGIGFSCDRLPIELCVCPTCGQGIKASRGWTWISIPELVGGNHVKFIENSLETKACDCPQACPLCHNVKNMGRGGLLWIGTQFYSTIDAFQAEAKSLGISRRIHTIPRGFELGKTWVLLAHARGIIKATGDLTAQYVPAIFKVWKPERIEKIYWESQRGSKEIDTDEKRGITSVFFRDGDKDHAGVDSSAVEILETDTPMIFGKDSQNG